jgi:hypothetical protein
MILKKEREKQFVLIFGTRTASKQKKGSEVNTMKRISSVSTRLL